MGLRYTDEKLNEIVRDLAKGIEALPERLVYVYLPLTSAISDAHVDRHLRPDLLERLERLAGQLTRVSAVADEGNFRATLNEMTADEAADIAEELIQLAGEVDDLSKP